MPLPATKVFLVSATGSGGYVLTPEEPGDMAYVATGFPSASWVTTIGDIDGDGVAEIVTGVPGNGDQEIGGGRVYIEMGGAAGGSSFKLGDNLTSIRLDGAFPDDHVGSAVAATGDMNGNGLQELVVGAPEADRNGETDSGVAYLFFTPTAPGSTDLKDLDDAGSNEGFAMFGEAAGDMAGYAVAGIADLNGDGRADLVVGAPGNDAGGSDGGAAYVVWGKATRAGVDLANVAAGTGGYRITGVTGEAAGSALATLGDLNGDGKAEILVGAPGADGGAGAAYVVFGKGTTSAVDLANVAAGIGGYRITGISPGEAVGMSLAALGDVNGDGLGDMLLGSTGLAYVVFGKADTAEVSLLDVADGIGGFAILPESWGDLDNIAVAGGGDLNRDGINDIVIGASHNAEGGFNAGAVYVVWGGGQGTVDLAMIAQGAGGAKVVGSAGSYTGSSVAVAPDLDGDSAADLVIGSPGLSLERVSVLYAPGSWQPDDNVYGTNGDDLLGAGSGSRHLVGEGDDSIYAFAGADSIDAGGGNDLLDGGAGADTMRGGAGDDVYYVDVAGDVVLEEAGGGADTVHASVSYTLGAEAEALRLTVAGRVGTGNAGDNLLLGSTGADTLKGAEGADTLAGDAGNDSLDGGTGADSMAGGGGNDAYAVDNAGDLITEAAGAGADTVVASIETALGANLEVLVLAGGAHAGSGHDGANTLVGGTGDDSLYGLGGGDSLVGNGGNDRLEGGAGADSMAGGGGDDLYIVDDVLDRAIELAGGGADTVMSSVDFTLGTEVEALVLTAPGHKGTGNALQNDIAGTVGADTLDGGANGDTLRGGGGDDVYVVDNAADVIVEDAAGGHDLVRSAVSYTLADSLEDLVLTGSGLTGTGNAGDNAITGTAGGDTLDGGAGADTLTGGGGNDAYHVDSAGDVIVEAAGGGADTVFAAFDTTLTGDIEALALEGGAHHGTGNEGDNRLIGGIGDDSLEGLGGADTLEGGAGADTMAGGDGDDTYFITDPGDVVIELPGGGFDTVVVSADWTLGEGIEGVQLLGSGHALTGNAENNTLSGNTGDDSLDGGEGDDVALGGDGDDVLVSRSGADTLSGGSGNDRFEVHGGKAHIEDFLGEDTIDASDATGDSYIDLSGDTQSEVEDQLCDFGQGGSAAGPLDLQFLQDLTGSFADDIATVRTLVPQIVGALQAVQPNSTYGVSSFRDKAFGSFGSIGDWVYRQETVLSSNSAALLASYTAMVAGGGADGSEAQIEALMQLALHITDIGFRTNSARFVVLFTDASYHVAGDGLAAGIPLPNNGDGVLDGSPPGTGEDYPAIAQLKLAIEAANIIPIFAVAGGFDADYQALVAALGRGAEVTLTADSSNVVAAITAGLTAVTQTRIEAAWGGDGADTLKGNAADNELRGQGGDDDLDGAGGNDALLGGGGADTMRGGEGTDTAVFDLDVDQYAFGHDDVTGEWRVTHAGVTAVVAADVERMRFGSGPSLLEVDLAAPPGWLLGAAPAITGITEAGTDEDADPATLQLAENAPAGSIVALVAATDADLATGDALSASLVLADGTPDLASPFELVAVAGGWELRSTAPLDFETVPSWALRVAVTDLAGHVATQDVTVQVLDVEEGIVGTDGAESILGTATDDLIRGLGGADTLLGYVGADTLDGGAGADSMLGGLGDDVYIVDDVLDRVVETKTGGFDRVLSSVTVTLKSYLEELVLTGDAAIGGTGNALANLLVGNEAGNRLNGSSGDDTILGLGGADTLISGPGADSLVGGEGNDVYAVYDPADAILELPGGGIDTVRTAISFTLAEGVENLTMLGAASIEGIGNALDSLMTGNGAANLLSGGDGADTFNGLGGADTVIGGDGDDVYVYGAGDLIVEVGTGLDTIRTNVTVLMADGVENLVLTGGSPAATGNALDNVMLGSRGNNVMSGEAGNDSVFGDAGGDTLMGGEGADTLDGGAGRDQMSGGAGADIFLFATVPDRYDIIADFTPGEDLVMVSAAAFGGGLFAGEDLLAEGAFASGTLASAAHAQFLWSEPLGVLYWDADGTGAGARITVALFAAGTALSASDIVVV
ncbi:cadherin domain-containing protein [Roseomonas sp. AR75]|uniref:cadherin domain-containing protein n=1 Tax=Roseomonas sp. AR75 TaxID=2562311 RepID=UPI0010BFE722|nr:cadherin domain-containing protein [Roseomonas sp. AR75]